MELLEFRDGTRYLELFGPEKYDAIFDRIRYLISQKSGISYVLIISYFIFLIILQRSRLIHAIIFLWKRY